jgi:hypothetical protein
VSSASQAAAFMTGRNAASFSWVSITRRSMPEARLFEKISCSRRILDFNRNHNLNLVPRWRWGIKV